jgi:Ca2+/H+ antiporter
VYLYCVALTEGKSQLVEGSIIGSIFAGILFLPGLSMCFGAIKRKTQRFNVKSAGVTSTMLLFAVIAAFGPTLFYQVYGSVSLSLSPSILKCKANLSLSTSLTATHASGSMTQRAETVVDATFPKAQMSTMLSLKRQSSRTHGSVRFSYSYHTSSVSGSPCGLTPP